MPDFRSAVPLLCETTYHWLELPADIDCGEVVDVAVDADDKVYLFNRGADPVIVVDTEGRFLSSFGRGVFTSPHAITIGPDGRVYCTDYRDHTVRIFTPYGQLLQTLGTSGQSAGFLSGEIFNSPTDVAIGPDGSIYVSDGYGNARVHRFDANGVHLLSWGTPGTDPGQFIIPHNIGCDAEGLVYVADRENHRVQVFDGEGRFVREWHAYRAQGLHVCPERQICIVAEDCAVNAGAKGWSNSGSRVIVTDLLGNVLQRFGGDRPGDEGGRFIAPHGVALSSTGDIFVADLSGSTWSRFFDAPVPQSISSAIRIRPACRSLAQKGD